MASWDIGDRRGLLRAATAFYAAVLAVAVALCYATGIDLRQQLLTTPRTLIWGCLAIIPMAPVYWIASDLKQLVSDLLGRPLSQCRVIELGWLAALAGISEEVLFRGLLQPWADRWHPIAGWVGANLLFGLLHALTPMYFVIATGFGFYFSALAMYSAESRSLVAPIVAHTLYDFVGFMLIAHDFRRQAVSRQAQTHTQDADAGL